jgi:hypothetical protein
MFVYRDCVYYTVYMYTIATVRLDFFWAFQEFILTPGLTVIEVPHML